MRVGVVCMDVVCVGVVCRMCVVYVHVCMRRCCMHGCCVCRVLCMCVCRGVCGKGWSAHTHTQHTGSHTHYTHHKLLAGRVE